MYNACIRILTRTTHTYLPVSVCGGLVVHNKIWFSLLNHTITLTSFKKSNSNSFSPLKTAKILSKLFENYKIGSFIMLCSYGSKLSLSHMPTVSVYNIVYSKIRTRGYINSKLKSCKLTDSQGMRDSRSCCSTVAPHQILSPSGASR